MPKPIYVEIEIAAPLEDVWQRTQTPEVHKRWDLRFTDIEYLPRPDPSLPQRFLYSTRIGFGLAIEGVGTTVGSHEGNGARASALEFMSVDKKSLIRSGSGYWKYEPVARGTRFLTQYDYETRMGLLGRAADRTVFRPLLGWATAWSFDRLRLWIERGLDPGAALRLALVGATSRALLASLWIYQGLVPKLLFPDSGEIEIVRSTGFAAGDEARVLAALGVGEILFGLAFLVFCRSRALLVANALVLLALLAIAAGSDPRLCVAPFNPVALNVAMIGISMLGLAAGRELPSGRRCLRRRPARR